MEQIGDMLILNKTEYKHNHQYYLVKCIKCGHIREVSKPNLLKGKGNIHSSTICREDYFKEFIGKEYGDYVVLKYKEKTNQLLLKCKYCNSSREVSESELYNRFHNPHTCKEEYYVSKIGEIMGDFKILDIEYNNKTKAYECLVECLKCNRNRWIKFKSLKKGKFSHKNCIELLPKDKITKTLKMRYDNIIQRTSNPNNSNFKNYGGRGIKCEFNDFIEFYDTYRHKLEQDITLTFDRIDVDGDYSYDNIRLITHKEQQSNKRNTKYFLAYKDNEIVLSNNTMEFGRVYGINGRGVGNCLRGKSKTAGGWRFKNINKEEFERLKNDNRNVTTKVIV